MATPTALVIGGAGFLGGHVADALHEHGYRVTIFDRRPPAFAHPGYAYIAGSLTDREAVAKAVAGQDYVYHFAGIADIGEAAEDAVLTAEVNVMGTLYVLEACRRHGVKRLMYASTIYVYSAYGSFYRVSKQSTELFIDNYHKEYGLRYTVLRYGSLYGRRANAFNFIGKSIEQALTTGKIRRRGNGEEVRDYINVLDAARASVELLDSPRPTEYVMLTGQQTYRVKDILAMIQEMFGQELAVEYTDDRDAGHYMITPYAFRPQVARKYVLDYYHDLGQGILDCIYETHAALTAQGVPLRLQPGNDDA